MHLLPYFLFLSCSHAAQQSNDELKLAWALWNQTIHSFHTSSYVYKLQTDCDDCAPCEQAPKYVVIENHSVQNIKYIDKDIESECHPAPGSYKTMDEWFQWIPTLSEGTSGNVHHHRVLYDDTYGFPAKIMGDTVTNEIECVSFLNELNHNVILNNSTKHCSEYISSNDDESIPNAIYSTECEPQVVEKDDCTQWIYVYMTIALSITLSTLSVLCFWLYYRQGIKPVTKGYKRSQSDADDYAVDHLDDENIVKSENVKRKSKLLGIDENKVIPKRKIKKKRKGKYGSIVQSDEDEKFENPFDFDSERSDDWNFVNDDRKKENNKKQEPFGGSDSDQTDEEDGN